MGSLDDQYIDEDASNGAHTSPFPYAYGAAALVQENDEKLNKSRYL
jgi:hypothetical protein